MSLSLPKTLIIFDVDGTLLDANVLDNHCFERAFNEIAGFSLTEPIWADFDEITAQAIVHQALKKSHPNLPEVEAFVKAAFFRRLQEEHARDPKTIHAFAGAVDVFSALKMNPNISVAIATGCWQETAHFKLKCAGFDLADVPFACASDCYARADIIALAAKRAGRSIDEAVYVGDGTWDLKATQKLGIPFIATGARTELLRQAGAQHALESWTEDGLLRLLRQMT